ncbi:hypothetical protein ACQ4PT_015077 [Festuca glaucescens]
MGFCLGKTSRASPRWSDLPPEIAGEILSRLSFHRDRLNFRAVCREWRLAARQHGPLLPPAVQCINLDHGGLYLNIVPDDNGGHRHRFRATSGYRVLSVSGSWVVYEHKRSRQCFIYKSS